MDGATNHIGRLEVCYYGEWGAVCDDLFDKQAALVACRQLGFERKSSEYTFPILSFDQRHDYIYYASSSHILWVPEWSIANSHGRCQVLRK